MHVYLALFCFLHLCVITRVCAHVLDIDSYDAKDY